MMPRYRHRPRSIPLLILGLIGCAIAGCAPQQSTVKTTNAITNVDPQGELAAAVLQTIEPRSPEIERGQKVVMGTAPCSAGHACFSCFQCHGIRGEGGATAALPRLAGQDARYLSQTLDRFASGERESATMTEVARALTEQQRNDVAAYYAAVEAPSPLAPPEMSEADAQRGRDINEHGVPDRGVPPCMSCHQVAAAAPSLHYPYLSGQFVDYLKQQLDRFRAGERQGAQAQVMQTIARNLPPEQGQVVSAYLAAQPPPGASKHRGAIAQVASSGTP